MEILNVKIKVNQKSQRIFIGQGILKNIPRFFNLARFSKVVVVTDRNVAKLYLGKIKKILPLAGNIIILPSGEKAKELGTMQFIWKKLLNIGSDRKTLIINLGGGVVCDLGGFAGSVFMRGLSFINIPTTLLAQVDASVGGKNGINYCGTKNLIGTFAQPVGVVVDTQLLATLPKKEIISGFAEIIKHGLIRDKEHFSLATSKLPLEFAKDELVKIIAQSIKIKADIVRQDQREKNLRKILNFGHTIGHAIEALCLEKDMPLTHGEAVSLGMLAEAKISNLAGLLSDEEFKLIHEKIGRFGFTLTQHQINFERLMGKIQSDKKNLNGKTNWTLLRGIGQAIVDQKVKTSIIKKALKNHLL